MGYNFLFYHAYIISTKNPSNRETPWVWPVMVVGVCILLNMFALIMFLDGFGIHLPFLLRREHGLIYVFVLLALLLMYYLPNQRYRRIIEKYKDQSKQSGMWKSIRIVVMYYCLSIAATFLAGMFKNHDWIFSQ